MYLIENESLKNAKFFQRLMIDAKIHCPDEKYIQLDNVAINANQHFTNTEEKLKICKNLENMITNGIFNGASRTTNGINRLLNSVLSYILFLFLDFSNKEENCKNKNGKGVFILKLILNVNK